MRAVAPKVWLSSRAIGLLLGIALLLALASALPGLTIVFALATVVFVAAVAADVVLGPRSDSLSIARRPVPPLALGRMATLEYVLRNRGSIGVRVTLFESSVANVTFAATSLTVDIPARSEVFATLALVPQERGRAHFGDIFVALENQLGLLRRRYRATAAEDVRIFPDLSAVEDSGRLARRNTLIESGLRRLRRRGGGTEFESLREYLPGDGFRFIDWKATAHRGRMMVAQYEVERSQNVIVALDCGRLMTPRVGRGRKLDYALTAALSVARIADAASDNIGLVAFAGKTILDIAPRRGAAALGALARATYDLQPRFEDPDYETTFTELRRRHSKRSLIILFTDIFDPVTSAAILAGVAALIPRHVAMCVLMNDRAVESALDEPPTTVSAAYRTSVAMTLADERAKAIAILRARGIIVLDVPADKLTIALMDAYLDVKVRGLL